MLDIKKAAVEKLKEILKSEPDGSCLRIFTTDGCCGGFTIAMDIAEKPDRDDIEVEKDGFKLYINREASAHLADAVMDCNKDGEIIIKGLPESNNSCCG